MSKEDETIISLKELTKEKTKDITLRKVDAPLFTNIITQKNFIRKSYEKIFLLHEIFKNSKYKVYDPLFFWSYDASSVENLDGKFLELELNFKVPDDAHNFPIDRERQILYSRYFVKEMIMHTQYALDYYYQMSPEYKKYLVVKECKKYVVDPIIVITGLALIKKLIHIIRFRQFVKKSFLTPLFAYVGMCSITGIHQYCEYVAHFTFMGKEILQQRDSVPLEQEYQDYLIFKRQLFIYERDRVQKTETTHPPYIRDDNDLILKSIKPKPIF